MEKINIDIDSLLILNNSKEHELKIIQWYVYQNIDYTFDWDLWKNVDYWPTAEETWKRKKEDCDGQAILAVSIMRSRGFKNARVAGNILHVWVEVDSTGIMGAMEEKSVTKEAGKIKLNFPSTTLILKSFAFIMENFPAFRILFLLFTILGLCYIPFGRWQDFQKNALFLLLGFIFIREWSIGCNSYDKININFDFLIGWIFLISSYLFSIVSIRRHNRKN